MLQVEYGWFKRFAFTEELHLYIIWAVCLPQLYVSAHQSRPFAIKNYPSYIFLTYTFLCYTVCTACLLKFCLTYKFCCKYFKIKTFATPCLPSLPTTTLIFLWIRLFTCKKGLTELTGMCIIVMAWLYPCSFRRKW